MVAFIYKAFARKQYHSSFLALEEGWLAYKKQVYRRAVASVLVAAFIFKIREEG